MEKLLLRVNEAAALAAIGRSKAYQLIASGEWPAITVGRCVRVPVDDLLAWIEEQKQQARAARESTLVGVPNNENKPAQGNRS